MVQQFELPTSLYTILLYDTYIKSIHDFFTTRFILHDNGLLVIFQLFTIGQIYLGVDSIELVTRTLAQV